MSAESVPGTGRALDRIAEIVREHLRFAGTRPATVAQAARRLGLPRDAVVAIAIADQVVEEFGLENSFDGRRFRPIRLDVPRPDARPQ